MVLKPVQFNQVCKCMAYIENLIMQPEWKIDAVSMMAQKRPLPNRWGMYSSQLCQISLKTYIIQTKWFLLVWLKTTYCKNWKTSNQKGYDKTNAFNIYCLGKMPKMVYTCFSSWRHQRRQKKHTCESNEIFHVLFCPTIFIWTVKKSY